MIWFWSVRCNSSPPDNAVPKNPIRALKEKCADLNSRVLRGFRCNSPLETSSLGGKNFPNTDETQLVPTGVIDGKMAGLVTTSHLFWPNEQRKRAPLLPIWLPNTSFLAANCVRPGPEGGGGGRAIDPPESSASIIPHRNFV
jgi:hypothetical protein